METIALGVFIALIIYYVSILVYGWITWDIPLIHHHVSYAKWVLLAFALFLILCLLIDGTLFTDVINGKIGSIKTKYF